MGILTANINFLASLGITTSEQFTAAFGDMADFTEYCTAIGYSWELDENNDIILITPEGKKVNTYVPAEESEKTATPEIVVTPGDTEYTFEAIGDGDVKLYIDEVEVSNPVAISRTNEAQEVTVTATAQEQGKQISDEAWEEVTIPALSGPSSISFETDHFTIQGNEGDIIESPELVVITDNLGNDVTEYCNFTFDPDDKDIHADQNSGSPVFSGGASPAGTYSVEMTADYNGLTATATVDVDISGPSSISFDHNSYSDDEIPEGQQVTVSLFSVTDDLGNDVTYSCTYSFSPNTTSLYVDGAQFCVTGSDPAGTYSVDATATYEGLTATATVNFEIIASGPQSISFDHNSYSISGTVGDPGLHQNFAVSDDLGNDVTSNCTYSLSPNDTGLTVSGNEFNASSMPAGTYSVDVTADYNGLTATATVNVDIASNIPNYMKLSVHDNPGNDGNITITIPASVDSTKATSLSYSTDGTNWTDTTVDSTAQTITIPVVAGDDVYLKGIAKVWASGYAEETCTTIISTADFDISGNIMSLLYGDNFEGQTTFPSSTAEVFSRLFQGNTHLIDASSLELPINNLTEDCYFSLFRDCTSLTTAPELPALALGTYCYCRMFDGCTSLTTAPELPATTLAPFCYQNMFDGCTSLTTAPELPATTLAQSCYYGMFEGCTSLNAVTMLAYNPINGALTNWLVGTAATGTLTASEYSNISDSQFNVPSGWTITPGTSSAPTITVVENTDDVTITATGSGTATLLLGSSTGSTRSVNNPYVAHKAAVSEKIIMLAYNKEVGLRKSNDVQQEITIPKSNQAPDYLVIHTKREAGNYGTIRLDIPAVVDSTKATSLSYSTDGTNWTDTLVDNTAQNISINVNPGDDVYLKGIANTWGVQDGQYVRHLQISNGANYIVGGNIMSLFYDDNFNVQTTFQTFPTNAPYALGALFSDQRKLIDAGQLSLPATTLTEDCYFGLFKNCSSLTTAPQLPATTLANYCYQGMFASCTSLTTAPQLPAATLAPGCYNRMFQNCTSLTTAPELPATTLANNCYQNMFNGCRNLNSITMLANDISATDCLTNWVQDVAATGTFTKSRYLPESTIGRGINGIPTDWTVVEPAGEQLMSISMPSTAGGYVGYWTSVSFNSVMLQFNDGQGNLLDIASPYNAPGIFTFNPNDKLGLTIDDYSTSGDEIVNGVRLGGSTEDRIEIAANAAGNCMLDITFGYDGSKITTYHPACDWQAAGHSTYQDFVDSLPTEIRSYVSQDANNTNLAHLDTSYWTGCSTGISIDFTAEVFPQ